MLVVEDELAIARFLRTSLQENGFPVAEASNGRGALELAAANSPESIRIFVHQLRRFFLLTLQISRVILPQPAIYGGAP